MSNCWFYDAVARGDWQIDPRSHEDMVFGEASHLVQDLQQVTRNVNAAGRQENLDFQPVIKGITALLEKKPELKSFLGEDRGYPIDSGISVLQGLQFALEGLQAWIDRRTSHGPQLNECLQDHFSRAIGEFDNAWNDPQPYPMLSDDSWLSAASSHPLSSIFRDLGRSGTNAGFWITWDLVSIVTERIGFGGRSVVRPSATTPVLFEQGHELDRPGVLAWLTVELLDGPGCGFHPDPLSMGLTALRTQVANHSASPSSPEGPASTNPHDINNFLDSLRNVWRRSGLAEQCRGRWRVSSLCPFEDPRFAGLPKFYPRRLNGRSAEAATLAAIWAAAGRIPYDPEFETSEGLAHDVAISACLGDLPVGKPKTEIPLQRVFGTGEKIFASKPLDTLIFANEEERSTAEGDIQIKQQTPEYGGLRIERAGTMGEALERMLVTSRDLAHYQSEVRARWLCQWEKKSGQAPGDTGSWTDKQAEAARERFFGRGRRSS